MSTSSLDTVSPRAEQSHFVLLVCMCACMRLISCIYSTDCQKSKACALQLKLMHWSLTDAHVIVSLQQKQTFEFGGLVQLRRLRNKSV